MLKTIFSKLIFIFVLILLISYSITGGMLFYFLDSFVSDEKEKELVTSGSNINNFILDYMNTLDNPVVDGTLRYMLKVYEDYTNAHIWVVNNDGYIVYTHASLPELAIPPEILSKMTVEAPGSVRLPDERQYKEVMKGHGIYKETGNFYGLFKDTGKPWIVIAKPILYQGAANGAVYLLAEMPKIKEARSEVFDLFMISVIIAAVISILPAYFFSLRISKPLKEMNNMAKIISGGDLNKRLKIQSNDEIGELAYSFNHMITALEKLDEMRSGFIANVSHELRTPMTSIKGFIEGILDDTIPAEKQKEYLVIVRDEVNRLSRLVNDLLDLARIEAGEMKLNIKDFNINELVRRCIIKLESLIVQKNLHIDAFFEKDDTYVKADADAIERVIINLMHNAVKFTGDDGKITIRTWKQKGRIMVSIEDNGIGIEKDEMDQIWDRFYKSDKSRSRDKTGTGLGLAIIKNIINGHNQEIKLESEPGKGSKFTFSLEASKDSQIEN